MFKCTKWKQRIGQKGGIIGKLGGKNQRNGEKIHRRKGIGNCAGNFAFFFFVNF
jgi:hypothetical protein